MRPVDHREPLLGSGSGTNVVGGEPTPLTSTFAWRFLHALSFLIGGITFVGGSVLLFFPAWPPAAALAAWLYTVGSAGFLLVDVQEEVTLLTLGRKDALAVNVGLSMVGSAFYVAGSVGYFPSVAASWPSLGLWGFLLGSALIGASQVRTVRMFVINRHRDGVASASHWLTFSFSLWCLDP